MEIVLKLVINGKEQKDIKISIDDVNEINDIISKKIDINEISGFLSVNEPKELVKSNKDTKNIEMTYKEILVNTMQPNRLLLYLYERAIAHLKQAKNYILSGDTPLPKIRDSLNSAYSILSELLSSFESTEGELFENLTATHRPLVKKLMSMLPSNDFPLEEINSIIDILTDFKITWRKALKVDKQVSLTYPKAYKVLPSRNPRGLNVKLKN